MNEEASNPVNIIRSVKRDVLKGIRSKHKEHILCNRRLGLSEVSENVHSVNISEFKALLLKLKQKNVSVEVLKKIKNSCLSYEYIDTLFRFEGAFHSLVRILIGNDAFKQLEAAACLTNLACGSHKCSYKVAKASGVYLISFVNGSSYFLQEQSSWALANIANDCSECFDIIKSQGVLPALLKALMSPLANVVQSVVFALNACTKYEDPEVISLIQKGLPDHLLTLVEQEKVDECMFLDVTFILSNCCFLSVKYSLNIFDTESVEKIIKILMKVIQNPESDKLIASPLLRCLGFLSYNDKISQFLSSNSDFYQSIHLIAKSENCLHLFKEAFWTLSNVAVSAEVDNVSDLMAFLYFIKNNLKQEKSLTLQILYYLSILQSKSKCVSFHLVQHEVYAEIKSLLDCEDNNISQASRTLLETIQ